jgi:transcriptional regulator with XRE-family HTH domain
MSRRREFRSLRGHLKWSQHETSREARLDRSKLSLYENGLVSLQPDEERRLESALRRGVQSAAKTFTELLQELDERRKSSSSALSAETMRGGQ